MASGLSLGQVLDAALKVADPQLPTHQWRTLDALRRCRTGALGAHRYRCAECGREHFVPHSCRNRHCPQCQGSSARDWLAAQGKALLPVPYFHLVFTLPHELNPLVRQNRKALYRLLFQAVSQTLLEFGRNNLSAQIGLTAILHTWSQTLLDHYHLHCIVPGGGIALDGSSWVAADPKYLFNVHALARVYRAKFRDGLRRLWEAGDLELHGQLQPLATTASFEKWLAPIVGKNWHVYSKAPFGGPQQVLDYLSRYTHRVAITPRRLLALDEEQVTFAWRDYAHGNRRREMSLKLPEFLRRFCLHILPQGFVKIRHYGLLANCHRRKKVALARELIGPAAASGNAGPPSQEAESAPDSERTVPRCPHCGADALELIAILTGPIAARAPP
ncbi:MAG: hypothetical protein ACI9OD_000463 [Limisphaerales bacterium]|jgi:hypothetical protein